ncbi:MAG: DNA recombination protein RmuC, partial [Saprospiraceae bacterium]|nr:DNA recombination protein RmuC [Saprospiraceae bacterium]
MDADFLLLLAGFLAIVLLLLLLRKQGNQSPDSGGLVSRDLLEALQGQLEALKRELSAKEDDLRKTHAQLAARDQHILHLQESLGSLKSETEQLQKRFQTEFENVANRLLEEKSNRFTEQNARNLTNILTPLREKIKDLEDNIDRKFSEESREKTSLREELKQLQLLNSQLSSEAHNLVSALKGQSKTQGDWGELQLETILEKSGLQKGVHFETQASMRDESGNIKRPDFVIHLPDNKHLIVDSKVSLSAFEQYFNSTEPQSRDKYLSDHIRSLRKHISDLSATNYQLLGP